MTMDVNFEPMIRMRTVEITGDPKAIKRLQRMIECNRESIVLTTHGIPRCKIEPASKLQLEMITQLYRRKRRTR
jgi:hypothetical protein